jgi:hypothetical protein
MRKFILVLVVAAMTTVLGLTSVTSAINYGGVGAAPAYPKSGNPRTQSIFIYQLKPGQSENDGVKVLNNTNRPQTISLDAVDSELASGGSFTCKQAAESKTDVGAWLRLQSTTVTLAPNSNKIVPFTISVPSGSTTDVGEHDGCITIQAASQTATKSSSSGILLSFRSAIRVVVTIPGKIVKKLDISSVDVKKTKNDKYEVSVVVSNDGNVSLDTKINTSLQNTLGLSAQSVNEGATPILPRSKSSLNYTLNHPFWGGWYRAKIKATYNSNPSAELGVDSKADQAVKTLSSATFFALPTPAAGAIESAVIIILLGAMIWALRLRKHASHVKRHWEMYEVKEGDTLESLANEFGVSWKRIAKVNKLKPPYNLKKDQKLKLPVKKD